MKRFLLLLSIMPGIWITAAEQPKIIKSDFSFEAVPVYRKIPITFQYDTSSLKPDESAVLTFQAKYRVKDGSPIKVYHYQGRPREILCMQFNDVPLTDEHRLIPANKVIRTNTTAYDVCNQYTNAWNLLNSDTFEMTPELRIHLPFEQPFDYAVEVTGLLKNGENVFTLIPFPPAGGGQEYYAIDLKNIAIKIMPKSDIQKGQAAKAGAAPSGDLPVYVPSANVQQAQYKFAIDPFGGINLQVNNQNYDLQSLWYWPNKGINLLGLGKGDTAEKTWQPSVEKIDDNTIKITASGEYYKLVRTIKSYNDRLEVFDEFTNLKDADTPIVGRTCILTSQAPRQIYAAGVPRISDEGTAAEPQNPTIYVGQSASGIGLMAREDVMRGFVNLFWNKKAARPFAGFELWHHVLPPRGTCMLHWTIVPTVADDYWKFVNTMRNILNTNFTIPGLAVFVSSVHPVRTMSDAEIKEYVKNRGIEFFLTDHYTKPDPKNTSQRLVVQGTDALNDNIAESRAEFRELVSKIKKAVPEAKVLIYFHSTLCSDENAFTKYAGCRALANGKGVSPYVGMILLFPTLTNSYGRDLAKVIELDTKEVGADGIYWDEMCGGYCGEADEWCGRHSIVSRDDYTVGKRYSFTPQLLTPWQEMIVKKLQSEGKWVIANTNPTTETMTKLHFPRFVEYNNYDSCALGQLYTPITVTQAERSNSPENILAQAREYLGHGSLTYELAPYNQGPAASVGINFDNLMKNMYPFTPIEIRPGVMIGKERILISRPGKFGWGDGSMPSQIKIFNEKGRLVDGSEWITKYPDKGLTAVRLPSGYTAALLRSGSK
jgi:hypothetical protein